MNQSSPWCVQLRRGSLSFRDAPLPLAGLFRPRATLLRRGRWSVFRVMLRLPVSSRKQFVAPPLCHLLPEQFFRTEKLFLRTEKSFRRPAGSLNGTVGIFHRLAGRLHDIATAFPRAGESAHRTAPSFHGAETSSCRAEGRCQRTTDSSHRTVRVGHGAETLTGDTADSFSRAEKSFRRAEEPFFRPGFVRKKAENAQYRPFSPPKPQNS